ncbi:MAG: nuclear transport factor 2 family protein, partial [Aeromicrobium sp.]
MGLNIESSPAEVVRQQYLASAAGDLKALRATLAPDVEWTEMAGFPLAGTYRTPEGVTSSVMEKLGVEWDSWTAHDDTYVVDGEDVVVLARYTAVHGRTGKPLAVRVAHHFVVRG